MSSTLPKSLTKQPQASDPASIQYIAKKRPRSLCGETETSDYLQGVLDDTEFRVVLNGNPHSRRKARSTRNLVCNGVGFWFGSRYSGRARS